MHFLISISVILVQLPVNLLNGQPFVVGYLFNRAHPYSLVSLIYSRFRDERACH